MNKSGMVKRVVCSLSDRDSGQVNIKWQGDLFIMVCKHIDKDHHQKPAWDPKKKKNIFFKIRSLLSKRNPKDKL